MLAYYINSKKQVRTIQENPNGFNLGFNVPEEHVLIALIDNSGNYVESKETNLCDFEVLFLNKSQTADNLGVISTTEFMPAGFRKTGNYSEQYVYSKIASLGNWKIDVNYSSSFEHELFYNATANVRYRICIFNQDDSLSRHMLIRSNDPHVYTIESTDLCVVYHCYFDGKHPVLWAIPSRSVILNNGFLDSNSLYQPLENQKNASIDVGPTLLYGDDAINFLKDRGQEFGEPSFYGW